MFSAGGGGVNPLKSLREPSHHFVSLFKLAGSFKHPKTP